MFHRPEIWYLIVLTLHYNSYCRFTLSLIPFQIYYLSDWIQLFVRVETARSWSRPITHYCDSFEVCQCVYIALINYASILGATNVYRSVLPQSMRRKIGDDRRMRILKIGNFWFINTFSNGDLLYMLKARCHGSISINWVVSILCAIWLSNL